MREPDEQGDDPSYPSSIVEANHILRARVAQLEAALKDARPYMLLPALDPANTVAINRLAAVDAALKDAPQ